MLPDVRCDSRPPLGPPDFPIAKDRERVCPAVVAALEKRPTCVVRDDHGLVHFLRDGERDGVLTGLSTRSYRGNPPGPTLLRYVDTRSSRLLDGLNLGF